MKFTIITPSFNQLEFLQRCVASVADQAGMRNMPIAVHHHIQDAKSSDGIVDWLVKYVAQQPSTGNCRLTFASEADEGMYDALNKGVTFALQKQGDACGLLNNRKNQILNNEQLSTINPRDSVIAWLNCDEQYLPGTLRFVAEYFRQNPEVDMVFGDYLVVSRNGKLLSYRKGYVPRLVYIQTSHLYTLSCTMFFRERVFRALGGFDARYKAVADEDFVVRALQAGFRAKHVRHYMSTFTFTGENLGGSNGADAEFRKLRKSFPFAFRLVRFPANAVRWIEKLMSGAYHQHFPFEYAIYVKNESTRKLFRCNGAGWKWPG